MGDISFTNNEPLHEWLKDAFGKNSSKRLIGTLIMVVALLMAMSAFSVALIKYDSKFMIDILRILFEVGGVLLGISVIEKFGKKSGS